MHTPLAAMRSQTITFAKDYRAEELRTDTRSRRAGRVRVRRRRTAG